MENFNHRKLGDKSLKIYSKPYIIEDIDTGVKITYKDKKEFDNAIDAFNLSFICSIDDSEFNNQINS